MNLLRVGMNMITLFVRVFSCFRVFFLKKLKNRLGRVFEFFIRETAVRHLKKQQITSNNTNNTIDRNNTTTQQLTSQTATPIPNTYQNLVALALEVAEPLNRTPDMILANDILPGNLSANQILSLYQLRNNTTVINTNNRFRSLVNTTSPVQRRSRHQAMTTNTTPIINNNHNTHYRTNTVNDTTDSRRDDAQNAFIRRTLPNTDVSLPSTQHHQLINRQIMLQGNSNDNTNSTRQMGENNNNHSHTASLNRASFPQRVIHRLQRGLGVASRPAFE
jgi:hypothetical protein